MPEARSAQLDSPISERVWDQDLRIGDAPLPVWWTYGFYASLLFALIYWIYYPAWPLGSHYSTGLARVTYHTTEGRPETWHWNSRALLLQANQAAAERQRPYLEALMRRPIEQVGDDPALTKYVMAAGKSLFANHCAACHPMVSSMQRTRLFPDNCAACHLPGAASGGVAKVADDSWIHGGTLHQIETSIRRGRRGYMPGFAEVLSAEETESLAHYVLSLSGHAVDAAQAAQGDALFHGHQAACFYCHGDTAEGRQDMGAANLTDSLWLWTRVPVEAELAGKLAAVRQVIDAGLSRGVMPAWEGRLSAEQIRMLTLYVHRRGGGK
jgi:cytochrome c oxidase cbb3-type subunit III